jgi:hypothetical protein
MPRKHVANHIGDFVECICGHEQQNENASRGDPEPQTPLSPDTYRCRDCEQNETGNHQSDVGHARPL